MKKDIVKIRMPYSDWPRHKNFLTDQEIKKIESSMKIRVLGPKRREFVEYNSTEKFENEYNRRIIKLLDIPMMQALGI
jgi:hypothetical protein